MENNIWAVIAEIKGDGEFDFDSTVSLFKNYDDALTEFQDYIEEEIDIMDVEEDDENTYIEEDEKPNGEKWWSVEFSDNWRFSKVYLRKMEVA